MDLLVVDTLEADVLEWLALRHSIRHAPELSHEPREFRRALYNVRATIVPGSVTIDAESSTSPRCCGRSAGSAQAPRTSTSTPQRDDDSKRFRWSRSRVMVDVNSATRCLN